jgi:VIT1/CCC1 family predicted Fe2+/Mn2+ transporter
MDNTQTILTIIGCILGSGGLSALITALVSMRKSRSESLKIDQETRALQTNNDLTIVEYVNRILKESEKTANDIAKETRKENEALRKQIDELNGRLSELMNWIITDNTRYRNWLERELRKVNPDIEFPSCEPVPNVFSNDHEDENH